MPLDGMQLTDNALASADLTGKMFYVVKLISTGLAVCGAGEQGIGILQDKPLTGENGSFCYAGRSVAILGGTVTPGAPLASDASGKLIVAVGNAAVIAIAAEGGALNEYRSVYVISRAFGNRLILSIPIKLAKITAAMDVVTNIVPGFLGTILKTFFVVSDPVVTAAKLLTLNLEINTVDVIGGSVALTSANCAPLGAKVDGAAITAANVFTATDTLSVEASAVTAFTEGEGVLHIVIG
jgi:hypothetical protein